MFLYIHGLARDVCNETSDLFGEEITEPIEKNLQGGCVGTQKMKRKEKKRCLQIRYIHYVMLRSSFFHGWKSF